MLKESSVVHVEGLSLTVRPNVKETEGKQNPAKFYFSRNQKLYPKLFFSRNT